MISGLDRRAFTLIEMMIVVAVLGLLAAIAIPNLLRARISANEGAIKSDLRTLGSACENFRAAQIPPAFPVNISDLIVSSSGAAYLLDTTWLPENQPKHGYNVIYNGTTNVFAAVAVPADPNRSAINTYCIDQTGVIVASVNGQSVPTVGADGCSGGMAIVG